jgi:PAS domain S-box-containing protein
MSPETTEDPTASLQAQIQELTQRLAEAEDTLAAIRTGEVDAVVVNDQPGDPRVYTLESSDRPYQVLIEQMQEGAVTLRADGTLMYGNRRAAGMLSIPQERLIGRNLRDFVSADDSAIFARLLHEARHAAARSELTLHDSDGKDIPVYVSLNLLHGNDPVLLCGVLTDLTEQKSHLRELAEANARLLDAFADRERAEEALRQAQKMEAVGQLTGGIAHDFNNILQGITGGIALAQQRIANGQTSAAPRFLDAALTACDRAATLTRRLLSFGRRQALEPQVVALDKLVADMEVLIRRTVGPSVKVVLHMQQDCWPVNCDPNQLENVLLNLAINARDALAPTGGRLEIETAHVVLGDLETRHWKDAAPGEYVRITVTDNGTGMPPDVLTHAFEPFFTTKPDGQGTGLGLSQVYGFVRQSHGMVRLESIVGTGTSVHLYLPRAHGEASAAAKHGFADLPSQTVREPEPETVLLVEDEVLIRGLAAEVLRESGYRVLEAGDGHEGLEALQAGLQRSRRDGVSILVTDVGLPGGLNGRQLAEAARELVPGLPVLLITGYAGDALADGRPFGPGIAMLSKPFALDVLTGRVQAMLGQAKVA